MVGARFAAALAVAAFCSATSAAPPGSASNWASDPEFDGIVDLLDPDYLKQPINVARLPLRLALTVKHGRGERVLYSFEDPECGYCRELNRRLDEIGNLTVHTFVLTFLGSDSKRKADAVWCAKDRAAAWQRTMRQESIPPARAGCTAPSADVMRLAEMLGINLTPTVFFADGSRMNGIKPRQEIEARLRAAGSK